MCLPSPAALHRTRHSTHTCSNARRCLRTATHNVQLPANLCTAHPHPLPDRLCPQAFLLFATVPVLLHRFSKYCWVRYQKGIETLPLEYAYQAPRVSQRVLCVTAWHYVCSSAVLCVCAQLSIGAGFARLLSVQQNIVSGCSLLSENNSCITRRAEKERTGCSDAAPDSYIHPHAHCVPCGAHRMHHHARLMYHIICVRHVRTAHVLPPHCVHHVLPAVPQACVDPWVYIPPPLHHKAYGWWPDWSKPWGGWGMPTGTATL